MDDKAIGSGRGKTAAIIDVLIFLVLTGTLAFLDYRYVPAGVFQGFLSIIGAFAVVWMIVKMRGERVWELGLGRPRRIWMLPIWIILIFVVTLAAASLGQQVAVQFIDEKVDISKFAILYKNLPMLIFSLISIWITAAFFEEIVYRGFLLGRLIDITGASVVVVVFMSLLHAVLFGLLHLYQGPIGIITTAIVGFVFGIFYVLQGRNLWALILVHGLIDTLSVIQFYLVGVPST